MQPRGVSTSHVKHHTPLDLDLRVVSKIYVFNFFIALRTPFWQNPVHLTVLSLDLFDFVFLLPPLSMDVIILVHNCASKNFNVVVN